MRPSPPCRRKFRRWRKFRIKSASSSISPWIRKQLAKCPAEAVELLSKLADRLEREPVWDGHELIGVLKAFAKENGVKMGAVMFPARVALTGLSGGPDLSARLLSAGKRGILKENPGLFPELNRGNTTFQPSWPECRFFEEKRHSAFELFQRSERREQEGRICPAPFPCAGLPARYCKQKSS